MVQRVTSYSIALFFLICCSIAQSSEKYSNKSSPFIKKEMGIEFINSYKVTNQVYQIIRQYKPYEKRSKLLSDKTIECIDKDLYWKITDQVLDRFIEETPSELIALNILWTVSDVGKKVKETGVFKITDPEVRKKLNSRDEFIDIWRYLSFAAAKELVEVIRNGKKLKDGIYFEDIISACNQK